MDLNVDQLEVQFVLIPDQRASELLDTSRFPLRSIQALAEGSNAARRRESLGRRLSEGNSKELIDRWS